MFEVTGVKEIIETIHKKRIESIPALFAMFNNLKKQYPGEVSLQEFRKWTAANPSITTPILVVQIKLRRHIIGEKFWLRLTQERTDDPELGKPDFCRKLAVTLKRKNDQFKAKKEYEETTKNIRERRGKYSGSDRSGVDRKQSMLMKEFKLDRSSSSKLNLLGESTRNLKVDDEGEDMDEGKAPAGKGSTKKHKHKAADSNGGGGGSGSGNSSKTKKQKKHKKGENADDEDALVCTGKDRGDEGPTAAAHPPISGKAQSVKFAGDRPKSASRKRPSSASSQRSAGAGAGAADENGGEGQFHKASSRPSSARLKRETSSRKDLTGEESGHGKASSRPSSARLKRETSSRKDLTGEESGHGKASSRPSSARLKRETSSRKDLTGEESGHGKASSRPSSARLKRQASSSKKFERRSSSKKYPHPQREGDHTNNSDQESPDPKSKTRPKSAHQHSHSSGKTPKLEKKKSSKKHSAATAATTPSG